MSTTDKTTSPDTLVIGSLKFSRQTPPKFRGGPRCVFTTNAKGRGELRFNIVVLQSLPGFDKVERMAVYLAGDKPTVALFPSPDGTKVRGEKSGALKMTGSPFRALAHKYRRITYRAEAIESPRKGWLLTAVESERHT